MLGIDTVASIDDLPDGEADLVVRVHTGEDEPRAAAGVRGAKGVRAAFVDVGGVRRGRARTAGPPRPSSSPWRPSSACSSPDRTARASSRRRRACARRSSAPYPPAGHDRHRQPVGQLRVELHELRPALRRGREPGRLGRQRRDAGVADYLEYYRRRSGDRPSAWRTSRDSPTAGRSSTACSGLPARCRVVLVKGGATAGGAARRCQPHGQPGHRRSSLRRRVPPGRRRPRRDRSRRRTTPRRRSRRSRCPKGPTRRGRCRPPAAGAW